MTSSERDTVDSGSTMPAAPVRRAVGWRSILLGLIGVTFICILTPYNDYVLGNTFLVGNFLPVGLLLFFMTVVMLVNAPLHLWLPRQAFTGGELAVALAMVLVACCLPSSGFMRYVPANVVGLNYQSAQSGQYMSTLKSLDLPEWMFPSVAGETVEERANSVVYRDFYNRLSHMPPDASLGELLGAIPWGAWVRPAVTWGLLAAAVFGAVMCLMCILRRQWAENERLAFPLAAVYSALIESPQPGRALNDLFRNRGFWIAFGAVFIIHGFNALNKYDPQLVPEIPIKYALVEIFANEPWTYMEWHVKSSAIYFSIVGFTYFLQTNVAFSLWFSVILVQLVHMQVGLMQGDYSGVMKQDQTFGALVVFAITIFWVGRHHWALVGRQMIRGPRGDEPTGRYLPYRTAGWLLVVCMAGMVVWLWMAGASLGGAVALTVIVLTFLLVLARVVAETGLIFVQINVPLVRPLMYLLNDLPEGMAYRARLQDYFHFKLFERLFTYDMREALPGYAINALRVGDLQIYERGSRWRSAVPFTLAMVLALGLGYLVSGASMLYVEYNFAAPFTPGSSPPINAYGVQTTPQEILDSTQQFSGTGTGPSENHNRVGHFLTGAGITTVLSVLRLRYVNWPLHPVGFLLVYSYPMRLIWFSVFLGWLGKTLLVKYGGAQLYRAARPCFIGMIIGEAAAAAFWLVVTLVRNAQGLPYETINLLPT